MANTYTVRITGDRFSWQFGSNIVNDRTKIKSVSSWGKLKLGNTSFAFCSNVTMSGITDVPDLTGIINLTNVFQSCSSITTVGRMNEWNLSAIARIDGIFLDATNFNQNIGNWNVSSVTNMASVFANCKLFNQNLGSWNTSACINFGNMFQGASNFNNGFASGNSVGNQLTWTINTTSSVTMSNMFINCTSFNANLGTGTTPWDVSKVTTFLNMFQSASNFNNGDDSAPINNWNINTVSDVSMESMFNGASKFNRDISSWNVSKVTTFAAMFRLAIAYNNGDNLNTNPITSIQGLDGWNINTTSSVTMLGMFLFTNVFNRPLASWNMTRVNNTNLMFRDALKFNQPLSNWERAGSTLANVTNMSGMFCNAYEFNQSIGNWNVSSVVKFGDGGDGGMFSNARAFNNGDDTYPLSNWSINSVNSVTMAYIFSSNTTSIFNKDISTWNMTKVTNTSFMFSGTYAFDQPLDNWERIGSTMGNITTMGSMFNTASNFNRDISSWNVSKVNTFAAMFQSATAFNNGDNLNINPITLRPGIDGWNINTVSDVSMASMFQSATAFDRNIGNWNISNVTNFTSFMAGKTNLNFSSTNLDAIYNGWIVNGVKPNINISFGTAKYTAAGTVGRLTLTSSPNNWIIQDGGL